mmetsp:Transcript_121276/g.343213  ORF Transcript_121276/g.343213 Transcript_121276/m.343213 type:complete len:392 (+) Transcript_121276:1750-2925(+)
MRRVLAEDAHGLAVARELQRGEPCDASEPVVRKRHSIRLGPRLSLETPAVQGRVGAPELLDEDAEGRLCGLAGSGEAPLAVDVKAGRVADRAAFGEWHQHLVTAPVELKVDHIADWRVGVALNSVHGDVGATPQERNPLTAHLVRGQRAGLVGTDDSGAAERFHRGELPHDSVALRHLARAESEARRDDRGQPLRNRSHRQRDRDLEVVDATAEERAVDRVEEVLVIDQPHQCANDEDDLREERAEVVQFLLQRCLLLVLRRTSDGRLDDADFCLHTSSCDDAPACTIRDRGRSKKHVDFRLDDALRIGDGLHLLRDALRLSGELRLLDADGGCLQPHYAHVRGDLVTDFDLQNVPGHHVNCIDRLPPPVPQHHRTIGLQFFQGVEGFLGI